MDSETHRTIGNPILLPNRRDSGPHGERCGIRKVIDKLNVASSGQFFDYDGENLPW